MAANRIEVLRPDGLAGVLLYRGTEVTHAYPRHWHEELHLCAYTAGEGRLRIRGTTHPVGAGDVILTPAGEVHENWVERGTSCSFRSLYLDVRRLEDLLPGAEVRRLCELRRSVPLHVRALHPGLLALHACAAHGGTVLEAQALLVELCRRLLARGGTEPLRQRTRGERRAVRQVQALLQDCLSRPVSLAQLSQATGLSSAYLHRIFSQETGMPPHAFQLQLRINQAKRLLQKGLPLVEIAAATGFADQAHLTRHFHRRVGLPPGRFRRGQQSQNVQEPSR